MATGDDNKDKVDPQNEEEGNPHNSDLFSPDESSPITYSPDGEDVEIVPDDGNIIQNGEIVREGRTDPLYYTNVQNQILVHIRTNYSKLVEVVPGELVRRVCTIYGQSEQATRIVNYVLENPSFLVPTMRYKLELKKRTIYQILNDLYPWVKKTDKTVEHPGRRPGPRPHVWIVDGEDLVEGVQEARTSYIATLKQHDPALKHIEGLKSISARIAHQLWDEGIKYGNPDDLMKRCQGIPKTQLHPTDYPTIESQVFTILREHREGSP